jgi:linoleoyl-CoA desaturase
MSAQDNAPGPAVSSSAGGGSSARIRFRQGKSSAFYCEVRARAQAYFERTGKSRFADWTIYAKAATYLALTLGAYAMILSGNFGPWTMLALANVYGIASLLLAINLGHDGAHAALARSPWINQVALYGSFTLIGADPYLWQMRHVRSHHVFPNVNGCDIDIDSNLLLRLSPNHPKRWYQRYQHLYAPFVFWIVDIHTVFIQDVHYLFKRKLANMVDIRHPPGAYAGFVACKAAFIGIVFAIPALVLPIPWWEVLIGALLMSFVSSCAFVYLLIGTHFAEETLFPETGEDGVIEHDWATHAMLTSLDWSPYSRIAHAIAGGSNAHAAHHLFPNVSHAHYRDLTRIIAETAEEFGMPHNVTTLPRMVRSHFRFLKRMGTDRTWPPSLAGANGSVGSPNCLLFQEESALMRRRNE